MSLSFSQGTVPAVLHKQTEAPVISGDFKGVEQAAVHYTGALMQRETGMVLAGGQALQQGWAASSRLARPG